MMRAILLALMLIAAVPAAATPLEDRLREQLRATLTQLNELKANRATLEAAKASAEQERDAARAKAAPGVNPGAARELAAARSQNATLSARAGAVAAELAVANARTAELAARLKAAEAEVAQQRAAAAASAGAAATTAASLAAATDRNARLVATGRDLVALHVKRYGKRRYLPLQLARTKIETEAQAMGDRVAADTIVVNPVPVAPK